MEAVVPAFQRGDLATAWIESPDVEVGVYDVTDHRALVTLALAIATARAEGYAAGKAAPLCEWHGCGKWASSKRTDRGGTTYSVCPEHVLEGERLAYWQPVEERTP